MGENLLIELAKQVPNLVIFLVVVWMFQRSAEKQEAQRVENAKRLEDKREAHEKALEATRQTHDLQMNNMWASYIKNIIDQQNETFKMVIAAIDAHDRASKERYEKMGITKDLLDVARETIAREEPTRRRDR